MVIAYLISQSFTVELSRLCYALESEHTAKHGRSSLMIKDKKQIISTHHGLKMLDNPPPIRPN